MARKVIDLGNGLQFDELLQIMRALKVDRLLDPALQKELDDGVNALLTVTTALQGIPWLLGILPGNIGGQLDGAVKALKLVKGLLEA